VKLASASPIVTATPRASGRTTAAANRRRARTTTRTGPSPTHCRNSPALVHSGCATTPSTSTLKASLRARARGYG